MFIVASLLIHNARQTKVARRHIKYIFNAKQW
ncbi:hypothetical protein VINI7043_08115 [Vibrio nigripulchritudo ATCC 27043]|nr:hypothetical protein VINI7043_08115 [Vibrio nigripulchritudo ATCC 27043]